MVHNGAYNIHLVPKLLGSENYKAWKRQITSTLQSSGTWKFIDGIVKLLVLRPLDSDFAFEDRIELCELRAAQA